MKELFPFLRGMNGGRKQHWISQNLDTIAMLADIMPFEDLRKALYCKADTLAGALQKAEKGHRPAITKAEIALMETQKVGSKLDVVVSELAIHAEVLSSQGDEVGDLKENLAQYFGLMSKANAMMEKLVSRVEDPSNFTYHIGSPNKREVGPTSRVNHRGSRVRLSNYSGLGRNQLPRPEKRSTHQRRKSLKRRPYVG